MYGGAVAHNYSDLALLADLWRLYVVPDSPSAPPASVSISASAGPGGQSPTYTPSASPGVSGVSASGSLNPTVNPGTGSAQVSPSPAHSGASSVFSAVPMTVILVAAVVLILFAPVTGTSNIIIPLIIIQSSAAVGIYCDLNKLNKINFNS